MYQLARVDFIVSPFLSDTRFVLNDRSHVCRAKSLKFHIDSDDYFGTLATVLDLLRQTLPESETTEQVLRNLSKDLLYLQEHYTIKPKHERIHP
jgi:hypothetical protein